MQIAGSVSVYQLMNMSVESIEPEETIEPMATCQ